MHQQVPVFQFAGKNRWAEEVDLKVQQGHRAEDGKILVHGEEPKIDYQEGLQQRSDLAPNVEDGQRREQLLGPRRQQLILDVADQLGDPDLAIPVGIKQIEFDGECQLRLDASSGDAQVQLRRGKQRGAKHQLRIVHAVQHGTVVDEETLEDVERIAEVRLHKLADPERVEADSRIETHIRAEPDRNPQRAKDREELRVFEFQHERIDVKRDQRCIISLQESEDLAGIVEERETERAAVLNQVRGLLLGALVLFLLLRIRLVSGLHRVVDGVLDAARRRNSIHLLRREFPCRVAVDQHGRVEARHGVGGIKEGHFADRQHYRAAVQGGNVVDQCDHFRHLRDQSCVDVAVGARQVDPGEVEEFTDDRDRRGHEIDDRLQRRGKLVDLFHDRADDVRDELAEVQIDVLDLDDLQTLGNRVA